MLLPRAGQAAQLAPPAPAVPPAALPPPSGTLAIAGLDRALRAANPKVDQSVWLPALTEAMAGAGLTSPKRIAAFLGQVSQEAGPGFHATQENLSYTHADRIRAVFPSEFPTVEAAEPYVNAPQKLADACYAHKLGNGGPDTGDGWRFCGRGLIQITGRTEYAQFAESIGRSLEDAAAFAATPEGAAASACWFWTSRNLSPFADSWDLASVTRRVNGNAMEGHAERVAMSEAALKAVGE
jgi:predicted chitinase